jgi:hypothetical protein
MNFAYDAELINDVIFKEFSDFSCMNILLKLVALER